MLFDLWNGVLTVLTPPLVFWLIIGTGIGLLVGYLPAIGAGVGIVLFLPFTYGMDFTAAIVFLMAIFTTGQYGDSITSILLNTPGGPGTVASCWEGYPMTRKGEGARALGIATFGSMVGGIAGCVGMVSIAQPLTKLAMQIGPPEYFALGVMALTLISIASKGETIKGLIMGCFGLVLSFIGSDPIVGFVDRFTFNTTQLAAGIPTNSVFVGMFAIAQIIRMYEEGGQTVEAAIPQLSLKHALTGFMDVLRRPFTVIRSVGVGIYIGILPALGITTATITSYLVEKKYSKDRQAFGTGAPSGLVAAEVAKGCCVVGDMIPTFMLGIPGSTAGAIVMAAFVLHGVQPGPQFLTAGSAPYNIFAGIILAQLLIVAAGLPLIKVVGYIVKVPNVLIGPVLVVLCFIGSYVDRNLMFDMVILIGFGLLGYTLDRLRFSTISLIIGLVIGPLIETNFHRTLAMGYGSLYLLWTRPLTVSFFIITFLFLSWPYFKDTIRIFRNRSSAVVESFQETSALTKTSAGDLLLLVLLLITAVLILGAATNYPHDIGLFPKITCYAMIALILVRFTSMIWRRTRVSPPLLRMPWIRKEAMSWEVSVATLAVCYALIHIVGFVGAMSMYLLVVPLILHYPKKLVVFAMSGVMTVGVVMLAKVLGVVLPTAF